MPIRRFMDTVNRTLARYAREIRIAWLVLGVLLAACNEGNGGGGPGY
jgi:hypothetical protein